MTKHIDTYDQGVCDTYKEISAYKWDDRFCCRKCGNETFFEGKTPYSRRCSKCKTYESVTAHTALNKLRIPLPIAVDIIRQIANGMKKPFSKQSVKDMEVKYGIEMRERTYLDFVKKIMLLTKEQHSFFERVTVFNIEYGNFNILLFKGKTENGGKYFACVYKGSTVEMNNLIEQCCQPGTLKVICTGKMNKTEYDFEIIHRDPNAKSDNYIYDFLLELWIWLPGIDSITSTQEEIQMYLDAFIFARNRNGDGYKNFMKILVTDFSRME